MQKKHYSISLMWSTVKTCSRPCQQSLLTNTKIFTKVMNFNYFCVTSTLQHDLFLSCFHFHSSQFWHPSWHPMWHTFTKVTVRKCKCERRKFLIKMYLKLKKYPVLKLFVAQGKYCRNGQNICEAIYVTQVCTGWPLKYCFPWMSIELLVCGHWKATSSTISI